MKCSTFFISFVCDHLFILLFLHFKFLSYHHFNGFCFHFFLIKISRVIVVSYCTLFFISNCNVLALITSSSLPKHSFLLALRRRGRFATFVYFGLKWGFKTPGFGLLPYTVDSRFFEPPWKKKGGSWLVKGSLIGLARIRSPETGNKRMNVESGGGHFRNFEYLSLARGFGTVWHWETKRLFTTSSLTGGGSLRVELIKLYRSMWRPRGYGFWAILVSYFLPCGHPDYTDSS